MNTVTAPVKKLTLAVDHAVENPASRSRNSVVRARTPKYVTPSEKFTRFTSQSPREEERSTPIVSRTVGSRGGAAGAAAGSAADMPRVYRAPAGGRNRERVRAPALGLRFGRAVRNPQAYEDLAHTADVGVRVRGATEEALARLALALGTLLAGGGEAPPEREERIAVAGGPGLAGTGIALLRELLFRFATERLIPSARSRSTASPRAARRRQSRSRATIQHHAEGVDVKAVTWHAARLEPEGAGWVAQAVLDI